MKDRFGRLTSMCSGASIGATLMYLFDPILGSRRRENLSETVSGAAHEGGAKLSSAWSKVKDQAYDVSDTLSKSAGDVSRKASKQARRLGKQVPSSFRSGRLMEKASQTGHDLLEKTRSYLPQFRRSRSYSAGEIGSFIGIGLGLLALGSGLMFIFDPVAGRRRRALVRDKTVSLANRTSEAVKDMGQDISNRAHGLTQKVRSRFHSEPVDDVTLAERVRSQLGRLVGHPAAVAVEVNEANVTLSGPVLAHEVPGLLAGIESVKGVESVNNCLEIHDTPENVPALQGAPRYETGGITRSPTVRAVSGIAGGAAAAYGIARRDWVGLGLAALGVGVLARGTSRSTTRLLLRRPLAQRQQRVVSEMASQI